MKFRATIASLALVVAACGGEDSPPPQAAEPEAITLDAAGSQVTMTAATTTAAAESTGEASIGTRLRNSIAAGGPREVVPRFAVVTHRGQSGYAAPVTVSIEDPRIRLMGGPYSYGSAFPYTKVKAGQAVTAGRTDVLNRWGLPVNRRTLLTGMEFVLPAGGEEFEYHHLSLGRDQPLEIEVDGAPVAAGFDIGRTSFPNGAFVYTTVNLGPSEVPRRVRLWSAAQPLGDLRLPPGQTLGEPAPRPNGFTIVFQGDSITEGSYATEMISSWPLQAAYQLGLDDPIVVAVGGSGYLARRPTSVDNGYNFRERMRDVLEAKNGGLPDMIVIAGGRNDCATALHPFTPEEVGVEARAYFEALRAVTKTVPIIVVGPFSDYRNPNYSRELAYCRNAIFQASRGLGLIATFDVSTWVNETNRSVIFVDETGDPHPTNAGHAIYAERFVEGVKKIAGFIR